MTTPTHATKSFDWTILPVLLLPPLFWAGNFIVGRAMRTSIPPISLSFYRWVIALLFLAPFATRAFLADFHHYLSLKWRLLGIAITGIVAFNTLVYWGLQSTSAANGLLLNSMIPLLVAGFAALFYKQHLNAVQTIGIAISFIGVLVIVSHGQIDTLISLSFAYGDAIIFVATICWAFYTLWLKSIPPHIDRKGLMMAQIILGLMILLPLFIWEMLSGHSTQWTRNTLMAISYIGIFPSVLAFLLYGYGISRAGAAKASLFIHFIPVFGVMLSVLFLHEQVFLYQIVGITTILAGVSCANLRPKRSQSFKL